MTEHNTYTMMKHNPDAEDVEECEACLDILTDPQGSSNEITQFATADRVHFNEICT